MLASTKAPGFESTSLKLESNTSILRFAPSSAAYKNGCPLLVAIAKPVYTAPAPDRSAVGANVAVLAPVALMPPTAGFHPLIVPSKVAKIKIADPDACILVIGFTPETVNAVLPFGRFVATIPVGDPCPPDASGIPTTSPAGVAVTVPPGLLLIAYSVENPVPLSLTQYGLPAVDTSPQALTR